MKVLIATPTVQGTATSAYARTLVALTQCLASLGAAYSFMTVDNADVITARNLLAHAFMQDDSFTHLLFIDSDMAGMRPVSLRLTPISASSSRVRVRRCG